MVEKAIVKQHEETGNIEELWIMDLNVTAVSPLYTGENKKEIADDIKKSGTLPTRKSGDGFAVMNISGIIRANVEKIYKDEGVCDVGADSKGCGFEKIKLNKQPCMTCDMFGFLGKRGRISVDELKSVKLFDDVVEIAVHPRINRDTGTIPPEQGATIKLEEIQEGTELKGRIIIRNPKEKDLVVLESAFKAMEIMGIGGWTRRGKGRVSIVSNVRKLKWSDFKEIGKEEVKKLMTK